MQKEHKSATTTTIENEESESDLRDLKQEIATIAGIECADNWTIFDQNEEEGLYLIHATIEPKIKGLPRGIVVDVHAKTVVCNSFGFTPTSPLDGLTTLPGTQDISIVDEYINRHSFTQGNYAIVPAYEGVVVRVFKHNNTVYFSTHKRLDCSRSKWGNSDRFLDIYKRLGGLSGEALFPKDVITSPWCYQFLLVDRKLLVATKQDIGDGFIVDLAPQKMWEYGTGCPYKISDIVDDARPCAGKEHVTPTTHSAFVEPPSFDLDEANDFLKYGYGKDKDERCGESVILYQHDKKGNVCDSVRVQSNAYHERVQMRGNNPNMRHRFYQLLNDAMKFDHVQELVQKYPIFYRKGEDKSFPDIWVEHNEQHISLDLKKTDDRIFLVYTAFFDMIPEAQKEEGLKLWDDFKQDRKDVVSWLQKLSGHPSDPEIELSYRVKEILRMTTEYAQKRVEIGRDTNRHGKKMSLKQLIHANVYNLIRRESGPSLFKLIRERKRLEHLATLSEE